MFQTPYTNTVYFICNLTLTSISPVNLVTTTRSDYQTLYFKEYFSRMFSEKVSHSEGFPGTVNSRFWSSGKFQRISLVQFFTGLFVKLCCFFFTLLLSNSYNQIDCI